MAAQKQVCDMRAGKRMSVGQSNEHLRIGNSSAWNANRAGNLDPTRAHLNFEIGKGGVVKEVDQKTSIPKRIKAILNAHGISDPNEGLTDEQLEQKRVGVRTHANFILEGSRETMRKLAFGDQAVNFEHGADNSHITRSPEIEKWAQDMYHFMTKKYGEENIAAFVVHLDETLPHIHATIVPITESGKLSYVNMFVGKDKYELSQRTKQLHDELAEVNKKWGLERGESVAVTGAQHKSYLQWLKEQIFQGQKTIDEQGETITRQSTEISEQKQQLYTINAEVAKANKKLKALTTMISNLEQQKEAIEIDITALEDEYAEKGNMSQGEYEKKLAEYQEKLDEIEAKIEDKNNKASETIEQIRELGKKKHQLQNSYDELQRKINKDLPTLEDRAVRDMQAVAWEAAATEAQEKYKEINEFQKTLSPEQQKMFNHIYDNIFDGSIFEELAERGNEIAAVGAALFLGYIDQATTFAQGSGGGGGGSTSGWGKKDDEDDDMFRRRCFAQARAMMKPTGRKLKRS